jgi:methyl-accepting chemotaxis protein
LLKLRIAAKLYLIFALLAAVTVALAAVAVTGARSHAALTDEFESAFFRAKSVEHVNSLVYAVVMESRGIYMSPELAAAKSYGEGLLGFNNQIGDVLAQWQRAVRADDADQFAAFSGRIRQFQAFRRELVRRGIEIGPAAAREWGDNDANRSVRKLLNSDLDELGKLYARRSEGIYANISDGIASAAWLLSLLGGAAVLLAAAGAIMIWRAVAHPLAEITRVTQAIAAGGRTMAVPFGSRADEIGELARSITVFQAAMQRNEELKRSTEAAEVRANRQDRIALEISGFSAEVEATLAEFGRISAQMLEAATHLLDGAERAATRTASATTASAEVSSNMSDIAAAVIQLAASVQEIDRQATQSNAVSAQAVAETECTNTVVKGLDQAAGRIGNVIALITDIAEQTNLLALNATIEAARAGDAGRSFAVVAGEVKLLAGQTTSATNQITSQIAGMQDASQRSIDAIAAIEKTIRQIGRFSGAIAGAVTGQGEAIHQIAYSAEIAVKRTAETAVEIERLNEATAHTRADATAVMLVADDLDTVATRIRGQIAQFFQRLHAA